MADSAHTWTPPDVNPVTPSGVIWLDDAIVVSYGVMFPRTCPPRLSDLTAGVIRRGYFHPYGSVARHFWEDEQAARPHVAEPDPSVYFIQSGKHGPIKIGSTRNVKARLVALQTAHPAKLRLLGSIPGGSKMERALHRQFAAHRLAGEWFRPVPAILEVIR